MRCVGVGVVRERRSLVAFQRENTRLLLIFILTIMTIHPEKLSCTLCVYVDIQPTTWGRCAIITCVQWYTRTRHGISTRTPLVVFKCVTYIYRVVE